MPRSQLHTDEFREYLRFSKWRLLGVLVGAGAVALFVFVAALLEG